ncbi:MAG: PAS domain S-box protein [Alphaproteobacteria bacterium]|nr:PAS domain S-box protein [Alphaproteobacteria bacterium]
MGLSGTVIGLDYRGVTVLGAHEPVAELDAGIVAKIDLAEVRRPFLQAGAISSAGALIIIILAIYLFRSVSAPIFAYVQAEDKLRVSEARLEAFFDAAPAGLAIWDNQLRFEKVNDTLAQINGKSVEEHLGKRLTDLLPEMSPEFEEMFRNILKTGEINVTEVDTPAPAEPEVMRHWLSSNFPIVGKNGSPEGLGAVVFEITDQKRAEANARESEANLSKMMAVAPDAIVAMDQDQRIRVFNQGAEKVFGYSSSEVMGEPLDILLPERYRGHHSRHIENFLAATDDSRLMSERSEIFGLKKDGTEFPAEASISKLEIGDETILTVMLHDVSERRQAEIELVAAKERAEYADRAKSEFLANMSHELRTPLNAIIGFSEMMTSHTFGPIGDPHYEEYSNDIFASGEHLLSLINDILDISKIEAGRTELNESELDVAKLIQDCLTLVQARTQEAKQSVRNNPGNAPPMLKDDERLVKQMLINLLSNANKFTKSGGEIAIECKLAENGRYEISVIDTGIGIAPPDIQKAMSTFGQVESSLDRRFEGSGLGLPLVKSLSELHGGGLKIESEFGVGTKATIWFPKERVVGGE